EIASSSPVEPAFPHGEGVFLLAFSPDRNMILTRDGDHAVQLRETGLGKPIGPPLVHEARVLAGAFSPDGKIAVTVAENNTTRLWNMDTGTVIANLPHDAGVG